MDDQTPNTQSDEPSDEPMSLPGPTDLAPATSGENTPIVVSRVTRLIEVEPDDSAAQPIEVTRRRRRVNHRQRWRARGVDKYRRQAGSPPDDDKPNLDFHQ